MSYLIVVQNFKILGQEIFDKNFHNHYIGPTLKNCWFAVYRPRKLEVGRSVGFFFLIVEVGRSVGFFFFYI